MNLKHTLYVIADAKALCSILYSSGNIQIICCWEPVDPPQLHHSHKKRKDSLKTRAKRAVLRAYIENYPILKLILLYRAWKYAKGKDWANNTVSKFLFFLPVWLISGFFFHLSRCEHAARIKLCQKMLELLKEKN